MTIAFDLTAGTRAVMGQGIEARARWIDQDRWVPTPTAHVAFQWMDYLLRCARRQRPICMLIVGRYGMGKTSMLRAFAAQHPMVEVDGPARLNRPVLLASATGNENGAKGLRQDIMHGAWPDAKIVPGDELSTLASLKSQGVKVVLLDEAGELLKSGPATHKRMLSALKELTNALGINIVATAVEGLDHALKADGQLDSRFKCVLVIPPWTETQDFRNFLFGFERWLPFAERSYLDRMEMVRWLLRYASGQMSDTVTLIHDAALYALQRDAKCVALQDFEAARTAIEPPPLPVAHAA